MVDFIAPTTSTLQVLNSENRDDSILSKDQSSIHEGRQYRWSWKENLSSSFAKAGQYVSSPLTKTHSAFNQFLDCFFTNEEENDADLISSAHKEGEKTDFALTLPSEMNCKIFSYLNFEELSRCRQSSKEWQNVANTDILLKDVYPQQAFGHKEWEEYYGVKLNPTPFPFDAYELFLKNKKNHMFVLIPEEVNGKKLTLNSFIELADSCEQNKKMKFQGMPDDLKSEYGDQPVPKAHWVLISNEVIKDSQNKTFTQHQELVADLAKQTNISYTIPKLLDAVICKHIRHRIKQKEANAQKLISDMKLSETSKKSYVFSNILQVVMNKYWKQPIIKQQLPNDEELIATVCYEKLNNKPIEVREITSSGLQVDVCRDYNQEMSPEIGVMVACEFSSYS